MAQKGNSSAVLLESEFEEGISDALKRTLLLEVCSIMITNY